MSDITFQTYWVPQRYVDRVQRAAVLYRIKGLQRTDEKIARSTIAVSNSWRWRVASLKQAGWTPSREATAPGDTGSRWTFMRNCCPTFAHCEPKTRTCRLRHVCPFCYARWVREVYKRIDAVIPQPEQPVIRNPEPRVRQMRLGDAHPGGGELAVRPAHRYHLVERRYSFHRPFLPDKTVPESRHIAEDGQPHDELTWLADQLRRWVCIRADTLRRVDSVGAFSHYTVEPMDHGWRFRVRQLFLVEPSFDIDQLSITQPFAQRPKLVRHTHPTRRKIYHAVARTCSYPTRLLTGDADLVKAILEARRGRRLTATTGLFRKRTPTHDRADTGG